MQDLDADVPFDLAAGIDYQAGGVVSRKLIQKPTGSVTLFAFDRGEGLSEHTAPFDALLYGLEGQADVLIAGEKHTVRAGQMIRLPANRPHALDAPERFKMLLVMVRS